MNGASDVLNVTNPGSKIAQTVVDSRGGGGATAPSPIGLSAIFSTSPLFSHTDYTLAVLVCIQGRQVSCVSEYPRTLGDRASDSIAIALVILSAALYQLQPSADPVQLQSALVIQGSRV